MNERTKKTTSGTLALCLLFLMSGSAISEEGRPAPGADRRGERPSGDAQASEENEYEICLYPRKCGGGKPAKRKPLMPAKKSERLLKGIGHSMGLNGFGAVEAAPVPAAIEEAGPAAVPAGAQRRDPELYQLPSQPSKPAEESGKKALDELIRKAIELGPCNPQMRFHYFKLRRSHPGVVVPEEYLCREA